MAFWKCLKDYYETRCFDHYYNRLVGKRIIIWPPSTCWNNVDFYSRLRSYYGISNILINSDPQSYQTAIKAGWQIKDLILQLNCNEKGWTANDVRYLLDQIYSFQYAYLKELYGRAPSIDEINQRLYSFYIDEPYHHNCWNEFDPICPQRYKTWDRCICVQRMLDELESLGKDVPDSYEFSTIFTLYYYLKNLASAKVEYTDPVTKIKTEITTVEAMSQLILSEYSGFSDGLDYFVKWLDECGVRGADFIINDNFGSFLNDVSDDWMRYRNSKFGLNGAWISLNDYNSAFMELTINKLKSMNFEQVWIIGTDDEFNEKGCEEFEKRLKATIEQLATKDYVSSEKRCEPVFLYAKYCKHCDCNLCDHNNPSDWVFSKPDCSRERIRYHTIDIDNESKEKEQGVAYSEFFLRKTFLWY